MPTWTRIGYTLIEIVVAVFVFAVGGLALAATSAMVGRELNANASRERAARIAANRLELVRAECRSTSGGRETVGRIVSDWSVGFPDSSHVSLVESITYPTPKGLRTDVYRASLACPR